MQPLRPELLDKARRFFTSRLGIDMEALLEPIEPERPSGRSLQANGVYAAIREARREDDPTLPLGTWAHDLKKADWDKVSEIAAHALATKTKDLQLAAWLLEAQLNRCGFEAITACVLLMQALCERYWDTLYPRIDEGDDEYRANILRWVNEKLLPQIRQLPITDANRPPREYHFADLEQARKNEQLRAVAKGQGATVELEGPTIADLQLALSSTPTEAHAARYRLLTDAIDAIEYLSATLDELWQSETPSLNALAGLLEQIQALLGSELHKRGVRLSPQRDVASPPPAGSEGGAPPEGHGGDGGGGGGGGEGEYGPIRDRADAYERLAVIADYLTVREPHSPVPALLRRAVEWGNMNTAELYHQIFLKFNATLNLFELLGLEQSEGK